jgi:hypothetical protein
MELLNQGMEEHSELIVTGRALGSFALGAENGRQIIL